MGIYDIMFKIITDRSCFWCRILSGNRRSYLFGNRRNRKGIQESIGDILYIITGAWNRADITLCR